MYRMHKPLQRTQFQYLQHEAAAAECLFMKDPLFGRTSVWWIILATTLISVMVALQEQFRDLVKACEGLVENSDEDLVPS
jgi:hypothetical protein